MSKTQPATESDLLLDYSKRCGGMWFDRGEVDQLRELRPKARNTIIDLAGLAHTMRCHSCQAAMDRNAHWCPACAWRNVIHCPVCAGPLQPRESEQIKIDICSRCEGVWFATAELAQIWNRSAGSLAKGKPQRTESHDHFLLGEFLYPWDVPTLEGTGEMSGAAVEGVGHLAGAAVEGTGHLAGAAVDGAGDLAGAVFGGIAILIEGIFA
jgi:Zn-finger nucleic acid-binding protein